MTITTVGPLVWLHTSGRIESEHESTWYKLQCPQCSRHISGCLQDGTRRKVWSCNASTCDGALVVLFNEDGTPGKVLALDANNEFVPVVNGVHDHIPKAEVRRNPRWPEEGKDRNLGGGVSGWDTMPDGKSRGPMEEHRMSCPCGAASPWKRHGSVEAAMQSHWDDEVMELPEEIEEVDLPEGPHITAQLAISGGVRHIPIQEH